MKGIKIEGTGHYVPSTVLTNHDLEKMVDTSDEWISSRTGIKQRHIVKDETTSTLAYQAAKEALKDSGIDKETIDLIIVATFTPDYFTPSVACLVQKQLGIKNTNLLAFDLNAACSGFVYALNTARSLLNTGGYHHALVIGVEVLSNVIDWTDRNTCVLFGDGAGAIILSNSEENMFYQIVGALGDNEALYLESNRQLKKKALSYLGMNGKVVFKFASSVVQQSIQEVLKLSNLCLDDIDYVVAHQANYRIIKHVYKSLKVDSSKFYINIEKYGNTSSASIPIALDEMNKEGLLKRGNKLIFVGFGGGLTWGATLISW